MSNVKFSKKVFEKDIGKLTDEMQQKIALFGTPVESLTENEIELEIFPDRPDLLSYQGFKRSFLAFLGKKVGLKKYKINSPGKNYKLEIDSSVKNVRPYTQCAIIKGLKLDDDKIKDIVEMQEKLHTTLGRRRKKLAIGIYPLEKIKLPISYKALEPDKIKFVPLEMDREMSGLQILQRHPTGRDYADLLAGKSKFPVFIDAAKKILSMPPIINSNETGKVTEKTKEIFVECSGFDMDVLEKALNIIVTTFAEMGGKIYTMQLKGLKNTPSLKTEKMKISLDKVNKLLGLKLTEKDLKVNLEKMGHKYLNGVVEIAPWRVDILHEVDLIEDVAIAYGYENFESEIPEIATIGEEDRKESVKRKIAEILTGINMLEVSNYHLTTKKDQFMKMGVPEKQKKDFVGLRESKTDKDILRKDLIHYLVKIISENNDVEYPQKIFEIGKVFGEYGEKEKLSCAIIPGNFTDIKQVLLYFEKMAGLKFEFAGCENVPSHFIDGRVAEIKIGECVIGHLGEVHPKVLKNWKIKMPVAVFEICLEKIFEKF